MAKDYSTTYERIPPRNREKKKPLPAIRSEVRAEHKGTHSELLASCWLIKEGYLVFRNLSEHGIYDLVIYDEQDNSFKGIDVKTASYTLKVSGERVLSYPKSRYGNIPLVLVDPFGNVFWEDDKDKYVTLVNAELTPG